MGFGCIGKLSLLLLYLLLELSLYVLLQASCFSLICETIQRGWIENSNPDPLNLLSFQTELIRRYTTQSFVHFSTRLVSGVWLIYYSFQFHLIPRLTVRRKAGTWFRAELYLLSFHPWDEMTCFISLLNLQDGSQLSLCTFCFFVLFLQVILWYLCSSS